MTDTAETLAAAIRNFEVDTAKKILTRSPHLANELTTLDEDTGETMLCFAITQRSFFADSPPVKDPWTIVSDEQAAVVQALIDAGADIEGVRVPTDPNTGQGSKGMLPLGNAAWMGKMRLVDLLIEAGADVNGEAEPNDSAIVVAADHRHAAVVERLIEAGANHDAGILARAGLVDRLAEFLDHSPKAINRPVDVGHLEGTSGPPIVAMIDSIGWEDPHLPRGARVLIERGADVNIPGSNGQTALQRARQKREECVKHDADPSYHDELIQILIDSGAE